MSGCTLSQLSLEPSGQCTITLRTLRIPSKPEVDPNVAGAQVTRISVNPSPERRCAVPHNRDASANPETIAPDSFQPDLKPVLPGSDFVAKESDGSIVVRHENINGSVVVEVADCRPPANVNALEGWSRTVTRLVKCFAFVVKQKVSLTVRVSLASQGFHDAYRAIRDEEIQPAVVVVVQPPRPESSKGEGRCRQPGL